MTAKPKSALLISYSDLRSDPRVRRQIDWLTGDGWSVDTLGLGEHPSPAVRDHSALLPQATWVGTLWGRLLNYGLLPRRLRFRFLVGDRVPEEVTEKISAGFYDLIVFEDYDFLPLLTDKRVLTDAAKRSHFHLDLHEYRDRRLELNSVRRVLGDSYYRWRRSLIGHPVFGSRTTVASRIADFYVEDFGFDRPQLVRNCPPLEALPVGPVDPANIKLLFHGMASWARGFEEILAAIDHLDARFTMTFMLNGDKSVISTLRTMTARFGPRVRIVPPVPMTEVARSINGYDLEIIFLPPLWPNLTFALPNKFFEAVQGRLGVIVGESPMMTEIVREYGNGAIVDGWGGRDLARTIGSLTADDVARFKQASDRAASDLNAEAEGKVFLEAIRRGRIATQSRFAERPNV